MNSASHALHAANRLHTWLNPKQEALHIHTQHYTCGSCSINQRRSLHRGKEEHTSLSASTYKRLSFILLKCYLINVLVTLNISTAGGTFVIVEMAGRVGHRWELLPHAGVDVWAAGWTRWAHVIDNLWIFSRERLKKWALPGLNEGFDRNIVSKWNHEECKAFCWTYTVMWGLFFFPLPRLKSVETKSAEEDNCLLMVISPLESITITPH